MSEFRRPRGTRDFGPEEMEVRRTVEARMRKAIEYYGYREIATPTFEHSDLFIARSGPQILAQIYSFEDKGGRELVLRPELTAPVMRFYSSDLRNYSRPLRIYYFGNCFRYERPQKGRYREFWQLGLEYIGKRTTLAISEVINSAISAVEAAGLEDFQVRIGHASLLSSLLSNWGFDGKDRELMIAVDKKDRNSIVERLAGNGPVEKLLDLISDVCSLEEAPNVLDDLRREMPSIDEHALEELKRVLRLIVSTGGSVVMDPSISRGLDYYDGVVFEIDAPSLGAEKQICGGGAYSLSEIFGKDVEGIGFGLGFDRILVALGDDLVSKKREPVFFLLPLGKDAEIAAPEIASSIRSLGVTCIMETSGRSFKKALSSALDSGATYLVIVGDEELSENTVSIKNLRTKEQRKIPQDRIAEYVKKFTSDQNLKPR